MFTRLIDDGRGEQPRRIEIANRESLEPSFLAAREAVQLCAPHIPQLDVNAIGTALAEEKRWHRTSLPVERRKGKTLRLRQPKRVSPPNRMPAHARAVAPSWGHEMRRNSIAGDRRHFRSLARSSRGPYLPATDARSGPRESARIAWLCESTSQFLRSSNLTTAQILPGCRRACALGRMYSTGTVSVLYGTRTASPLPPTIIVFLHGAVLGPARLGGAAESFAPFFGSDISPSRGPKAHGLPV